VLVGGELGDAVFQGEFVLGHGRLERAEFFTKFSFCRPFLEEFLAEEFLVAAHRGP